MLVRSVSFKISMARLRPLDCLGCQRLGINTEALRNWVNKAEVDFGQWPGTTTEDKKRTEELEREP
ncbi:MAG: hypothetical protein QOG05_1462 [Streptosporangiaceae bacterium]|jgi:transposase-like protein|nr:hypothetical protein [Streptosporangiaceae bacterium]